MDTIQMLLSKFLKYQTCTHLHMEWRAIFERTAFWKCQPENSSKYHVILFVEVPGMAQMTRMGPDNQDHIAQKRTPLSTFIW